MELIHGGDVHGYRLRRGGEPLDFSASLNPLGMPASVRDAARRAVDGSSAYPDPLCRDLTAALAARLGVPAANLFCGNGAADVIYRFVQALKPRRALLAAPTFAEYERALLAAGCACEHHFLRPENGFVLDEGIAARITPGLDALFICQPNNPTGRLADPELLRLLLERTAEAGTLLFVDECFCRFVEEPERHSLLDRIRAFDNLFILDSFTKLYAMAGLRLGYGVCGNARLVEKLFAAGQPWTVSAVAQAAGLAALGETDYVEESRNVIFRAKAKLADGLEGLGNTVVGRDANYVFFRSPATDLAARLEREGMLIRDCANFRGLEPGHYRAAVRLEEENDRLLEAMGAAMNGEPWPRRS